MNILKPQKMLFDNLRTIENLHTVLVQVLNLAVEEEYLRNNPSINAM